MTKTITSNITAGLTLASASYDPLAIAAGVSITNGSGSGNAIQNSLAAYWSITNQGYVAAPNRGVALTSGGALTNQSGGTIAGYVFGVSIIGGGSVANSGRIDSTGTGGPGIYAVGVESGTFVPNAAAVYLSAGAITNATSAVMAGPFCGVDIGGGGRVVNAGAISGSQSRSIAASGTVAAHTVAIGYGVVLGAGGGVTNQTGGSIYGGRWGVLGAGTIAVQNAAQATIAGADLGVISYYQTGVVTNAGTISGVSDSGVDLRYGGTVTNQTGGTIGGGHAAIYVFNAPGTVVNQGSLQSRYGLSNPGAYAREHIYFSGVSLAAGGTVSNLTGGTIAAYNYGVAISGGAASVSNAGLISGRRYMGGAGVQFDTGVAVTSIAGTLVNATGGLIAANWVGVQLGHFATATGQGSLGTLNLDNSGTIIAADFKGDGAAIWAYGAATITNEAGGLIQVVPNGTIAGVPGLNGYPDGGFGIVAYYQTTVINRGTIGGAAYAFVASNKNTANTIGNLIEMAPGAAFRGVVKGADGSGASTLELLSGTTAGVISNIGQTVVSGAYHLGYTNFARVTVDPGAAWTLTGGNTIASGVVFTDGGAVTNAGTLSGGVTLGSQASLTNLSGASLTNASGIAVYGTATATVVNTGLLGSGASLGVSLKAGGSVSNGAGGSIGGTGILIAGGAGTVTNAGSIGGTVSLAAGFADRVIVDPGAVFAGTVNGGNSLGASTVSTLQLGSGASAGTLSGLGTSFVNFGAVRVDPGATWTIAGANTLALGATLTDRGAMLLSQGTVTGGGALAIADTAGVAGYALIGAGGRWLGTGPVVVGGAGTGVMEIAAAGSATAGGVAIAAAPGASGQVTVTGTASALSNTGSFVVGVLGLGSLAIQSGGTATTSAGAVIASSAGASGSSVNVSGAGRRGMCRDL